MFTKVLLVDDIDLNTAGAAEVVAALGIEKIVHAKYCDEALLKIKKALFDNKPFDLLITDLSFEDDYRETTIKSGEDLLKEVKKLDSKIKLIAFSIENEPYRIKNLFDKFQINGYVMKGRNTKEILKKTIEKVFKNEDKVIADELLHLLNDTATNEIDSYDIELLKQLSLGYPQEQMPARFKELGIEPNSKSTIEKRISKLKDYFKAANTIHLIAIAKDLRLV